MDIITKDDYCKPSVCSSGNGALLKKNFLGEFATNYEKERARKNLGIDFDNVIKSTIKHQDFINITDKYNIKNISISEAIKYIPPKYRKEGQVVTFIDLEDKWAIYQFKGESVNQWNNYTLWENLYKINFVDSIIPDDEDLELTDPDNDGNSKIKLKDRLFNVEEYSGKGYKILRKNIVEIEDSNTHLVNTLNYLYLDMIDLPSTIYEIRYDFDLSGLNINIPLNSILFFNGGSIDNGTVTMNNCEVIGTMRGTFVPSGKFQYSGLKADEEDITIHTTLSNRSYLKLKDREYNPELASGKGYKILRKNWTNIGDKTINLLTQDMINEPNTVYEIRYDFDLNGQEITIPEGCLLIFNGGHIVNGTLKGDVLNKELRPEYFSLNESDYTEAFININNLNTTIKLANKDYPIHNIVLKNNVAIIGDGTYSRIIPLDTEGTVLTLACTHIYVHNIWIYGQGMNIGNLNGIETTNGSWIEGTARILENIKLYKLSGTAIIVPARDVSSGVSLRADVSLKSIKITEVGNGILFAGRDMTCNSIEIGYCNGFGLKIDGPCNCFSDLRSWGTGRSGEGYGIEITENGNMTTIFNGRCQENFSGCIKIENAYNCFINYTEDDSYSLKMAQGEEISEYPEIPLVKLSGVKDSVINIVTNILLFKNYDKSVLVEDDYTSTNNEINIVLHNGKISYYTAEQNNFKFIKNINTLLNKIIINGFNYDKGIEIPYDKLNFSNSSFTLHSYIATSDYINLSLNGNYLDTSQSTYLRLVLYMANSDDFKSIYDGNRGIGTMLYIDSDFTTPISCTADIRIINTLGSSLAHGGENRVVLKSGTNLIYSILAEDEINNINYDGVTDIIIDFVLRFRKVSSSVDITDKTFKLKIKGLKFDIGDYINNEINKANKLINLIPKNYSNNFPNYALSRLFNLDTYLNIDSANRLVYFIDGEEFYNGNPKTNNAGNTSSRPSNINIGFQYFDTTLNKPILWTGTKWVDSEGNDADSPMSGSFADRPTEVKVGYSYFCTDKQTTEGTTNGIMIYYKGSNTWVDALGRVVS